MYINKVTENQSIKTERVMFVLQGGTTFKKGLEDGENMEQTSRYIQPRRP